MNSYAVMPKAMGFLSSVHIQGTERYFTNQILFLAASQIKQGILCT